MVAVLKKSKTGKDWINEIVQRGMNADKTEVLIMESQNHLKNVNPDSVMNINFNELDLDAVQSI